VLPWLLLFFNLLLRLLPFACDAATAWLSLPFPCAIVLLTPQLLLLVVISTIVAGCRLIVASFLQSFHTCQCCSLRLLWLLLPSKLLVKQTMVFKDVSLYLSLTVLVASHSCCRFLLAFGLLLWLHCLAHAAVSALLAGPFSACCTVIFPMPCFFLSAQSSPVDCYFFSCCAVVAGAVAVLLQMQHSLCAA